jgi:hypothetical protein
MDFRRLVKDALRITWQDKKLWFFAALPLFSSAAFAAFLSTSNSASNVPSLAYQESLFQWQQCLAVLSSLLLGPISAAGMIGSTKDAYANKAISLGPAIRRSLHFFGRILLLLLNVGVVVGILLVGFVILAVILSEIGNDIVFKIIAAFIAIPIYAFLATEALLGQRAIVIDDLDVGKALNQGWELIRLNLGKLVIFFVLLILLAIVAGAGGFFVVFISLKLAIPAISFLIYGIFIAWSAFYNSLWTLAYLELRTQPPAAAEPQPAA